MKKGMMPRAQPLRVLKPKQPNNVRSKSRTAERMDEYIQRFNNALYNNGIAKF